MKISRTNTLLTAAGLLTLGIFAGTGCDKNPAVPEAEAQSSEESTQQDNKFPSVEETREIAEEGFIYGLPIVMNYATMIEYAVNKDSGQYKAPFNEIWNDEKAFTYKDTAVVSPNSDTPYSMIWLDLRTEPMVVSVPDVDKKRYYSVQFVDGNLYNYGYVGSRATGSKAGDYLVLPPDWEGETPEGFDDVFQPSTPFGLVIFRTQLFNEKDMPNVAKVQKGYKVQPLSEFKGEEPPEQAPKIDFVPASSKEIKENFWKYLDAALEFIPETELNKPIIDKLARIGVGPTAQFGFEEMPQANQEALKEGMKSGTEKVAENLKTGSKTINGWQIGAFFGNQEEIGDDWLKRATGAKAGIYGNDAEEATYPATREDKDGDKLDGSKNKYTLTFEKGKLPPVNAFWSVTMYDAEKQLLVKNPIDRYLINSTMLSDLKKNPDGSITLYIQHESPGKDKESNWLPAPDGPIYMAMRLYWPKTEPPSILPPGEGTWQPPSVVKAK